MNNEINEQIQTYIPKLVGVSVDIEARIASLYITIRFNSNIVTVVADTANNTIQLENMKGE